MKHRGDVNWISGGMAAGLVVVSAAAMVGFLALSAYAPQFRTEAGGRPNVLSKSAIGFAGIRVLLEASGTVVEVNRSRERLDGGGLSVLTPDATSSGQSVAALAAGNKPVLIVLPKWVLVPDYVRAGWVRKVWAYDPAPVAGVLKGLDDSTTVVRPADPDGGAASQKPLAQTPKREKPMEVTIVGTASFGASPFPMKRTIDGFQTVAGKKWVAELTDGKGHAVLARLKDTNTFVLSDPDFLNTAALKNEGVAAGALALIGRLPGSNNEVVFDVTLAGFDTKRSLLHSVFAPPFLAATLCALLAAALMAFRAMNRFGSPRQEERSFAFGKRSLADNTASLIRTMGRGPGMAPRYAAAIRRLAAKALRGGKVETIDWLDAVERSSRIKPTYAELLAEAETVQTEPALIKLAIKLHDWKSRIIHEHP